MHKDCPTSRSTQRVKDKQITAGQRQRAQETVDIQETWADGAGRIDKEEEEWSRLREDVANPNLHDFKLRMQK